jgi:release factor glutamine methyltransferase
MIRGWWVEVLEQEALGPDSRVLDLCAGTGIAERVCAAEAGAGG